MGTYTSKYTGEQIDNLLGQVEKGGGSGSGRTLTTLFEGECGSKTSTQVTTNLTLSQSVKNFDAIGFYYTCVYNNSYLRYKYEEIPVDMLVNFLENVTVVGNRISLILGYKDAGCYWDISAPDSTDTVLGIMASWCYVTKIVGINY